MSVRKGDRTEGQLQVLNRARELKKYSIGRVKNVKTFPKSTRWIFAQPIITEVREACTHIRHANSVYLTPNSFKEEFMYRRLEQTKAHANLDAMYDLIEDAYLEGYIDGRQAKYWTELVIKTDELLKSWMKYDRERYKNFINNTI